MPLILLGLIVFLGIVIYALVQYGNSDDTDDRPVRVKYPHVFKRHADDSSFDYEFDEDEDGSGSDNGVGGSNGSGANRSGSSHSNGNRSGSGHSANGSANKSGASGDGHTMYFPDDAEVEKRKRNIH